MGALEAIAGRQLAWATTRGLERDRPGYVTRLIENLYQPLSPQTEADYRGGAGKELEDGPDGEPAKMRALESSSALVCNVFDFWRTRRPSAISGALGLGRGATDFAFEAPLPSGLQGTPPTRDFTFVDGGGWLYGVEAKFCEPYRAKPARAPFADSYFPDRDGLWEKRGLPKCQELARELQAAEITFERLDAGQLLKHALGLRKQPRPSSLFFLWYAEIGGEQTKLQAELEVFARRVDRVLGFRAVTYQAVFEALRRLPDAEPEYVTYLASRYFATRPAYAD